jgi:hypothetical protein
MLRLIGALGAGVGFAGGIFTYPYIFLTDIVGTDTVDTAARREVARGTRFPRLSGAEGGDPRGVRTRQKAVTSRWPTGIRAGAEFKMPTMA